MTLCIYTVPERQPCNIFVAITKPGFFFSLQQCHWPLSRIKTLLLYLNRAYLSFISTFSHRFSPSLFRLSLTLVEMHSHRSPNMWILTSSYRLLFSVLLLKWWMRALCFELFPENKYNFRVPILYSQKGLFTLFWSRENVFWTTLNQYGDFFSAEPMDSILIYDRVYSVFRINFWHTKYQDLWVEVLTVCSISPVSYTHLDVYKRQLQPTNTLYDCKV